MHLVLMALLAQTLPAADPTTDWLMHQSAPAGQLAGSTASPATQPAGSPFGQKVAAGPSGAVTLSDGTVLAGALSTTPGKPLRFWVEQDKRYVDATIDQLASMDADVVFERDEPEWQYAASGQDQKVYTGKTYPAREVAYHVTLQNGDTFLGSIAAPLTVATAQGDQTFVLHKRDKGDIGVPIAKLIYVKKVAVGGKR